MIAAVRTILIADLVMSLDNVIAVAAAAKGSTLLLILGLAISIPLIIYASTILIKLMERFPVIITIGAALIGWVAGEMAWEDKAIEAFTSQFPRWTEYVVAALCAVLVIVVGRHLAKSAAPSTAPESKAS
jgi:predicted tellurium resistance membrane protein TerC